MERKAQTDGQIDRHSVSSVPIASDASSPLDFLKVSARVSRVRVLTTPQMEQNSAGPSDLERKEIWEPHEQIL